jgi:DNA-binding Lrp family transcriptional regulator
MGIVLVILGITSLSLTDVKAYLLINVKQGYSKGVLMEKIWKIKGVESIATIAGGTDLIAKVRTRSLGKGYERVIRRLEEVEGIEEFKWQSILKEWEEI